MRRLVLALLVLLGLATTLVAQDVLTMDNEEQKDWLTSFVQDRLSTPERQIRLSNIDGALGSDVSVREITISDAEGVWLRVSNARLNWNQAALFTGRLEVRTLAADSIDYYRNPIPVEGAIDVPPPEAGGLQIPEFPVAIELGELSVPRVSFGEDVFGLGSEISLAGSMTLDGGNLEAKLDIVRLDGPGGSLGLDIAYDSDTANMDLGLALQEPENGVLANLLNIENRPAMSLALNGSGSIADLRADLTLTANGETALSGIATVKKEAQGFAIDADLNGPLSTLMAEPYRPFFGAETQLTASALLRDGGGLTLSQFRLVGGQMVLGGSAETTPDNFLSRLVLSAAINDADGNRVILPVPGGTTSLGTATLSVDYGTGGQWSADLDLRDLSTPGIDIADTAMTLSGVVSDLENPAARRITLNGDGSMSGIGGDPAVEAALGDSVGLGLAGLWNAGEPINIAEFRIVADALTAALAGEIDGTDFDGTIALEAGSIAPFSGLAGRDLDGALSLKAQGRIMPLIGGFDLTMDGTGTDLAIGDAMADRLLAGTVSLSGRFARTEAGIEADQFRVANEQVQFLADGRYASDMADFAIDLDLSDLALLSDQASGALTLTGRAIGTGETGLTLDLLAEVDDGTAAGRALRDAAFGFNGTSLDGVLKGDIQGSAEIDGYRAVFGAGLAVTAESLSLTDLDFQAAGTRITGNILRNSQTGLIDGRLAAQSPDISVAAALALLDAEGEVNFQVALAPQEGRQSLTATGAIADFALDDMRVGSADLDIAVDDLFGVPVIDGSAKARDVAAAGITARTLTARANTSGDTTRFDAQAALATGTDIDLAGALSPIDGGYSLALERASLTQGALSAALARPSVLRVAGDSVALDALRIDVGSGSITASGTAGQALDLVVDINALPLSIANTVSPGLGLAGTLAGRARVTGDAADPRVAFEAQASGVNATAIGSFGIAPLSAQASGAFADGIVSLASLSANGTGGLRLDASGNIPLDGGGLDLAVTGSAPLSLANRFVADRGGQASGVAQLDARVTGSLAAPQFSGRVSTAGAGFIDPELNLRLTGITGSATLAGTNLSITSLSANLATGGSVSASGSIGLTPNLPADLRIALNAARYADGNLFVATASGNLALTGNLTGSPLLSGDVLVDEANITVPENFAGGAQMIDVDHVNIPRPAAQTLARAKVDERSGAPIPQSRPSGMVLDVTVRAPNRIFIRGRGLDAEVGGQVRLTGPLYDIQPVGAFELNRGRLSILGQRVTFDSGSVTLVGDLDPVLDLVARTEGEGITVFVTVSGRASDIQVSFSSAPMLPQDEVLSRLIFKRSMGELSPLQLAQLAAAAAELVGGGGGNGLVDSLRGAAGLADLDVVTDDKGNVAVQAGTYIQDNVYLGVTAGAGGQSKVTINLDVTDDLTVKGAAGQDGNSSLGVFYEKDY